jgi:hypothetical protein
MRPCFAKRGVVKYQVDFGHDQTALVELWQVVEE